ncbi:hypothetical protein HH308_21805 [Gordonia sp. TBRC 11910]|uniref:SWIM-type domain-containing protein n=1 Tax=Gordonia asplenii TaxID=2725283 RepID=A0A848L053_9ACTN|nr:hypothetical protein [Gordonia asplenii]NMO03852.1 hypothetical protein [Gordonia asplenii]
MSPLRRAARQCAMLDDAAWAQRASVGLVRRAHRDLLDAQPSASSIEDELVVEFGGHTQRWDARGPDAARCDCPATGVCRHVVAVGLWLGAMAEGEPPEPVVETIAAVEDAAPQPKPPTRSQLRRETERARMRQRARQVLLDVVRLGVAHASADSVQRCAAVAISAQTADHYRLAAALRRIGDQLERIVERTVGVSGWLAGRSASGALALELATTYALLAALDQTPDAGELLGAARTAYTECGPLRLIGLGSYPWESGSGYRGLTTMFFDGTRFVSVSQTRPTTVAGFDPIALYTRKSPIWPGLVSAATATAASVVLTGARLNADGRLSGTPQTRAVVEPLSSAEIMQRLVPIRRWDRIAGHALPTAILDVPDPLGDWVTIMPTAVGVPVYDDVAQQARWVVVDDVGSELIVAQSFSMMSAHATRRLRTVDRSWEAGSFIVGQLVADATLRPLSVLRPHRSCADQPVDALHFDAAPASVRSAGATSSGVVERADTASELDAFMTWLERTMERGLLGSRDTSVRGELTDRRRALRDQGFGVFGDSSHEATSELILRSYAIAEQVRRVQDKP